MEVVCVRLRLVQEKSSLYIGWYYAPPEKPRLQLGVLVKSSRL